MTHAMTYFEHVPMPYAMPIDDLSTGQVDSSLVDSIGTTYNYHGFAQTRLRRFQFSHRGKYVGAVDSRSPDGSDIRVDESGNIRVTSPSIVADLDSQADELKAMRGIWGKLWRRRIKDGQLTWRWSRLLGVQHIEGVDNAERVTELESRFETNDTAWRSEDALTASVSATNGVQAVMSVPNSGILSIPDAILRVECTSGTITQIEVAGDGIHFIWTGTLTVGQVLEIDSGISTVTKGIYDAYAGFNLHFNHTYDDWIVLERGNNTLWVTVSGGAADIEVEYNLLWP